MVGIFLKFFSRNKINCYLLYQGDEEPVDPYPAITESCKPKCTAAFTAYQAITSYHKIYIVPLILFFFLF